VAKEELALEAAVLVLAPRLPAPSFASGEPPTAAVPDVEADEEDEEEEEEEEDEEEEEKWLRGLDSKNCVRGFMPANSPLPAPPEGAGGRDSAPREWESPEESEESEECWMVGE